MGATTSDLVVRKHWMWPGRAFTSGATSVSPFAATSPQTPSPKGMRSCPAGFGPRYGPRTRVSPSSR